MTLLNLDFIKDFFTHNQSKESDTNENEYIELKKVPYRWTHGATDLTLGDGLLVYSIIHYMRAKNCVCLGSGGGFIPRIMTQARVDLYDSQIFEGDRDYNWGIFFDKPEPFCHYSSTPRRRLPIGKQCLLTQVAVARCVMRGANKHVKAPHARISNPLLNHSTAAPGMR